MSAVLADLEPLLTTSQVAHRLGCAPSACVRWIQKGSVLSNGARLRLEAIATPGGWRIRPSALDAFLAALTDDRAGKPAEAPNMSAKSPRVVEMHSALAAAGFAPGA
jgi:hypothetical protein